MDGKVGFWTMNNATGGPEDTGKQVMAAVGHTMQSSPQGELLSFLSRLTKVVYSCLSHNIGTRDPVDRVWICEWLGGRGVREGKVRGVLKAFRGMTWVPGWSE